MKRIVMSLAVALVAAFAVLTGCGLSEATILDVSFDGFDTAVSIDPANLTVAIDAPPVAPESLVPEILVSSGAVVASTVELEDGVGVPVTVIARNGDEVTWTLALNLRYGVSFDYNGSLVILENGFTDSGDPTNAEAWQNGTPPGWTPSGSGEYMVLVTRDLYDWITPEIELPCYVAMETGADVPGTHTVADGAMFGYFLSDPPEPDGPIEFYMNAGSVTLISARAVGDPVIGTFEGVGTESNSGTMAAIDNGFFKVIRLVDDVTIGGSKAP